MAGTDSTNPRLSVTLPFATTMRAWPSVFVIGNFIYINVNSMAITQGQGSIAVQLQALVAGFVSMRNDVNSYILLSAEL